MNVSFHARVAGILLCIAFAAQIFACGYFIGTIQTVNEFRKVRESLDVNRVQPDKFMAGGLE